MRKDAQLYVPFKQHFTMQVLKYFAVYEAATTYERQIIQQYCTQDAATGYNTLPGAPGSSKVFWMQHRRRQRR